MTIRYTRCMLLVAGLAIGGSWSAVQAQDSAPAQSGEPAPPAETQPPVSPSLDDLLGLTPDKDESKPATSGEASPKQAPPAPPDPSRTALDRKLTATEASEQFMQAVQLMGDTAERLSRSRDTGIETQRLQDEIIRKLDMLIQMAEQQQQQQQSSSSSSSDREQDQQPAQPQPSPQQAGQAASDPEESDGLPPGQAERLNPEVAARGAAWGNLPARARDALLQGNADTYSRRYQRWTEEYYRRLAEEGNR